MGLDDFGTTEESSSNTIKTRKQIENVELEEKFWDMTATTHPGLLYTAASNTDESSTKAIVQKIDEAINGEIEGHNISDEMLDDLENVREDIVDDMLD